MRDSPPPKVTRSRAGCRTCRDQKKKCDEIFDEDNCCQRCLQGSHACTGRPGKKIPKKQLPPPSNLPSSLPPEPDLSHNLPPFDSPSSFLNIPPLTAEEMSLFAPPRLGNSSFEEAASSLQALDSVYPTLSTLLETGEMEMDIGEALPSATRNIPLSISQHSLPPSHPQNLSSPTNLSPPQNLPPPQNPSPAVPYLPAIPVQFTVAVQLPKQLNLCECCDAKISAYLNGMPQPAFSGR